jgi:DEAD/DEAH box helicase domain-containing protein
MQPSRAAQRQSRLNRELPDLIAHLRDDPHWRARIVHWHEVGARQGSTAPFPAALHPRLKEVLRGQGLGSLYAHQARAIECALAGRDVLISTPTASGKTLCYTAPVLHSLLESNGCARALFLFPTKALAQDQTVGLTALVEALGQPWHAFTYDGDTPPSVRRSLRDRGHMILTNPHMLHQGILPNHAKWSELFRDLKYIVVDEVHTLTGVFGSSVANVLRRLLRIARHYGAEPIFIASSATLKNPESHTRRLFGRKLEVIDEDASPAGARTFGVLNPPIVNALAGLRANALEEARDLAREVCAPNRQVIFFCGRRTAVEVLTRYLKEGASRMGLDADQVRGYRGGYLPDMRREIESGLKDGSVKVVVSTNALELGIDIGALDVAVLVGYPGSQASFWQRAGRVGRRGNPSLVVQIARSEPVDQFLVHHPDWLFAAPKEELVSDPDNLVILSEQLKCAAFELPFHGDPQTGGLKGEPDYARTPAAPILDYLCEESHFLLRRGDTWYWMADAYPAQDVSLNGGEADNVLVLDKDTGDAIGEVDRESSITQVHEGAIYQVQGVTWRIERFDHTNRRAYARKVDSDYFTEAETNTEVRVLRLEARSRRLRAEHPVPPEVLAAVASGVSGEMKPAQVPHSDDVRDGGEDYSVWRGEVHVTTVATQYKKVRFYSRENVGAGEIHLPPEELTTEAFVLTLSEPTAADLGLAGGNRGAAWRGMGNLLRRVAPLYVRCSPSDLGISSQVRSPHFRRPTLYLYDRVQGGVGLGELVFRKHRALLAAARQVLQRCSCAQGCPACVGPLAEVGPLGKETAARLLVHLATGPGPRECEASESLLAMDEEVGVS